MNILTMRHADIAHTGVIITTDTGLTIGTPRSAESVYWQAQQDYLAAGGVIDPVIITPDPEPDAP